MVPLEVWQQLPQSHADPWPAVFFHSELRTRYHITATPKLVILKPSGEVITNKGRKQIQEQGRACFQDWVEASEVFQNFSG